MRLSTFQTRESRSPVEKCPKRTMGNWTANHLHHGRQPVSRSRWEKIKRLTLQRRKKKNPINMASVSRPSHECAD
jgi:hypothetical protein